jgi:hypothetical protein
MTNLDNDLRAFFSDRQKLTQIDQLHRLLFQCLLAVQTELPSAIRKALDEIALQRSGTWKRRDAVPVGRNGKPLNYTHIGFVYERDDGKWPTDLCVHFGYLPNLFREPWVGAYTLDKDEKSFKRIQDTLRPLLENAEENGFSNNEPYPIYRVLEEWPNGCSVDRIAAGGSVVGLERLLDEGEEGAVAWITKRIVSMLDALQAD